MDLARALILVQKLFENDSDWWAVLQRKKLAELLQEEPPTGVIALILLKAKTREVWVDPRITDEAFPTTEMPSLAGVGVAGKPVTHNSTDNLLSHLRDNGRRAATAAEAILYAFEIEQRSEHRKIVALGQHWIDPESRRPMVVVVTVNQGSVRVTLDVSDERWFGEEEFLSFPLPMAAIGVIEATCCV